MNTETENLIPVQLSRPENEEAALTTERPAEQQKRKFVEPAVSFPIDVLEATTFFQLTDSGPTS